jgi:heat shock protein HslJ
MLTSRIVSILLLAVGLSLIQCQKESGADLADTSWRLRGIKSDSNNGNIVVKTNGRVILRFKENTVEGSTGCNKFGGNYRELERNKVKIDYLSVTEAGCPAVAGTVEDIFIRLLYQELSYTRRGSRLILKTESEELQFIRE